MVRQLCSSFVVDYLLFVQSSVLKWLSWTCLLASIIIIIIIIIIKNEKIRVTLCENAAGALYIVNKMCVDGLRSVEG